MMWDIFKIWSKWTEKNKMDKKWDRLYTKTFGINRESKNWKLGEIFGKV